MADEAISQLAAATTLQPDDLLVMVDVHDATMAPSGTDKKLTLAQLFGAPTNGDLVGWLGGIPAPIVLGSGLSLSGSTLSATATGAGTVTSVSVAAANGFTGTVANPTTTPVLTLTTSATGLLKGSAGALVAAVAGTDYVTPSGSIAGSAGTITGSIAESQVTNLTTDLAALAPLASPALTGTPTAPTAAAGTQTTQLATTAFVMGQGFVTAAGAAAAAPVQSVAGKTGAVVLAGGDLPAFAASGAAHAPGAVPDPGATAGTARFLREDATWAQPPSGSGTVTSVGLAMPSLFTVSGSPVTGSGTLTAALAAQAANTVLAGPGSGSAAAPAFRGLADADLAGTSAALTAGEVTFASDVTVDGGLGVGAAPGGSAALRVNFPSGTQRFIEISGYGGSNTPGTYTDDPTGGMLIGMSWNAAGNRQLQFAPSEATGSTSTFRMSVSNNCAYMDSVSLDGTDRALPIYLGNADSQVIHCADSFPDSIAGIKTLFGTGSASAVTVGIRGASSQADDLTQWLNSSGTVLGRVSASGAIAPAGYYRSVASKSAAYTAGSSDDVLLASASSGAVTITLPSAAGIAGRQYTVKKTDSSANAVTVATTSAQTIDGATIQALSSQYQRITVVSDGSNWQVI